MNCIRCDLSKVNVAPNVVWCHVCIAIGHDHWFRRRGLIK